MDEPTLELKTLPSTLKYAFHDDKKAKPVIISSKLDLKQEEQLVEVLRKNKEAIGWMTCRFRALLKHKDDGQTKFIKPNSQRQDIIKYWVSIGSIHREQG